MQVTHLELENFRNYKSLSLDLASGVNVLYGRNGQGKTNVLESVYICTCASSHRTSRDKELISYGEDAYRVKLNFLNSSQRRDKLDIHYMDIVPGDPLRSRRQRIVRHNGLQLERIGHLMGLFNAVIFAPEDLRLIKDGPQARRRFIDLLISQIRPIYFVHLQTFNSILQQRNSLLKKLRDEHYQPTYGDPFDFRGIELDTWDELAEAAVNIIAYRHHYINELAFFAKESHAHISGGKENLSLEYKTLKEMSFFDDMSQAIEFAHNVSGIGNFGFLDGIDLTQNKDQFVQRLRRVRSEDIKRGNTNVGPHRDDINISFNDMPLRLYGSQGQQRTAVLALKMAELKLIEKATYQRPVLLLDDVMSELDFSRRECLVDHMKDGQVLLTCTEAELVSPQLNDLRNTTDVTTYVVKNNNVIKD